MIKLKDLGSSEDVLVIASHKYSAFHLVKEKYDDFYMIDVRDIDYRIIKQRIEAFLKYARARPTHTFWVTSTLGANIDIAPMFAEAPDNCVLPVKWNDIIGREGGRWWGA